MTTTDPITLDADSVRELVESLDRFLATLADQLRGKIAEEERRHLKLVEEDDG